MKQQLYDRLCAVLTDYESCGNVLDAYECGVIDDMYSVMCDIQNNWEMIRNDTD